MPPESRPETVRLFYALWPDDATRTALMRLQTGLPGRKIPYDDLHVTLAFLGAQSVTTLTLLKEILDGLQTSAPMLTLDRVSYFKKNRIVWAGMHAVPHALLMLQRDLVSELEEKRVSFDRQLDFTPHVTLARDALAPSDAAFTPIVWQADEMALVESVTGAEGAHYRVLASRSLLLPGRTANENGSAQRT